MVCFNNICLIEFLLKGENLTKKLICLFLKGIGVSYKITMPYNANNQSTIL